VSTLVTALKTGNLVRALSYPEGPFTVFAPTNQAFSNLPAGVLAYLLAHPQELDAVLAYHVVDARGDRGRGRLYADEIHNFQEVFTLNGQSLVFVLAGGKVLVNGNATVVQANVDTSNGVVHVIDTVLIPNQRALEARAAAWNAKNLRAQLVELGAEPNLLQLAQSVPQLSTLVTAVTAAGIGSVLAGKGPLTVFAPNSESAGRRRAHASCLRACACEILRLRNSKILTAPLIPSFRRRRLRQAPRGLPQVPAGQQGRAHQGADLPRGGGQLHVGHARRRPEHHHGRGLGRAHLQGPPRRHLRQLRAGHRAQQHGVQRRRAHHLGCASAGGVNTRYSSAAAFRSAAA
jgi:hypothetical protein